MHADARLCFLRFAVPLGAAPERVTPAGRFLRRVQRLRGRSLQYVARLHALPAGRIPSFLLYAITLWAESTC